MIPFSILDYGKKTFSVYYLEKYLFFFCLAYFIIIAGGRYYPGTGDWDHYRGTFEASGKIGDIRMLGYFEPGFELLANIIKTFSDHYVFFFTAYEVIVCVLLYYNIKNYLGYPITTCCLYFSIFFLTMDLIQIRSLLAVQIFIFSIQFIKDRRIVPFVLCIICSTMIHITSIILFPLYFVLDRRFKKRTLLLITIIGVFINLLAIDLIVPIFGLISPLTGDYLNIKITAHMLSAMVTRRPLGFIHIEFLFFFPLLMKYRKKLLDCDRYGNIFFNMFILYGMSIFYLWRVSVLSGRIKFFFITSLIYLIPRFLKINKKIFILVFLFYGIYVLAMAIYTMFYQSSSAWVFSGLYSNYVNYFFSLM